MQHFFTSDTHFCHANVIKYCNRPFKDVTEMDRELIARWNARVKADDVVYHLGDVIFHNSKGGDQTQGLSIKPVEFLKQLNGRLIVILGNHDHHNKVSRLSLIHKAYIHYGGTDMCLVHKPEDADLSCRMNLTGHVHHLWKFMQLSETCDAVNVGVDQWNFQPITITDIMSEYTRWKSQRSP